MNTIGEVYTVTSDILLGGNVIYLPLESEFSGVIYQAEMKLLTKDPVYLQVWRPTTTENMYKFISEVEIEAEETGMTMNVSCLYFTTHIIKECHFSFSDNQKKIVFCG